MTTPTQAQIEADQAQTLVEELLDAAHYYELASGPYVPSARRDYFEKKQKVIATLTAAAEVGPKYEIQLDAWMYRKLQEHEAETIERCARVAEQWQYDKHPTCKSIAATLRALKDQA